MQCASIYRQVSNISRTLVGNKIIDHSDVVGASPVGAAPTTSSFSTEHLASIYCTKTTAKWDEEHLSLRFGATYIRDLTVVGITVWLQSNISFLGTVSLSDCKAKHRKISNIKRTKSQKLNVLRLVLQLTLPKPLKPGVKSRMKM